MLHAPHRHRAFLALAAAAYLACALIDWHAAVPVRRSAGIVAATLILWIGEIAPLGVVALAIPVVATFAGILSWKQAISVWGDEVVFLFLGAFLLARALEKHKAFDVFASRWFSGRHSATKLSLGVMMGSGAISTVQNNTAVTAMLLPVVTTLARRTAAPAIVMLSLAYGATFGGVATPVGTAPNFIGYAAMKKIDKSVSFVSWLRVGVPAWLGTSLIGWGVLHAVGRRRKTHDATVDAVGDGDATTDDSVADAGEIHSAADKSAIDESDAAARRAALFAMGLAALAWIVIGCIKSIAAPGGAVVTWIDRYAPDSLVPIVIAWSLFIIRVGPERRTVLSRRDFLAIDWDTLFLIAGGLCLGEMLKQSGANLALADAVAGLSLPPMLMLFALAGATVLLSELTSNTATASLMVPIAASLAAPLHISPVHAIWLVALSASLGFILPVSTPPNALVYGTRLVPLRTMALAGVFVDLLCTAWIVACVSWFA